MNKYISNLITFRKAIKVKTTSKDIERIFGINTKEERVELNKYIQPKIDYALSHISNLLILDWVKYIGITGSIAAGSVKQEDDIDLFIVVKNNRIWLYRGFILLKNFKSGILRKENEKHTNNKLCDNIIREERSLKFNSDMFNFHELVYMKPIYKQEYVEVIFSENSWIENFGHKEVRNLIGNSKRNYLYAFVDFFAMLTMVVYMTVLRHNPNYKRIWRNYKKGKIEFYPENFKKEKLKEYRSDL